MIVHTVKALITLSVVLQILDANFTYLGIELGAKEGNPLVQNVMDYYGMVLALVLTKAFTILLSAVTYYRVEALQCYRTMLVGFGTINVTYFALSIVPWSRFILQAMI